MNHRIRFLVIIALGIVPVMLWGQPTKVTSFSMGDDVQKTIVREYGFPASIGYVETTNKHFFVYNDGMDTLRSVAINPSYFVEDIAFEYDFVFFCGSNGSDAFFGFFQFTQFFDVNQEYYVTTAPMNSPQDVVTSLKKMVVYYENGYRKMVAIGQTSIGQYCVVELSETASGWNCRVGELGNLYNEQLLDITLTDNYIVTAGVGVWGTSIPCVRVYDRTDIFSTATPIQDNISFLYDFYGTYQSTTYDLSFDLNQLVLSSVASDFFLMAAYWQSPSAQTPNYSRGLYAGCFQVTPSGINSKVSQLTGAIIPQPYTNQKWELRGMTSLSSTGMYDYFYVLQEAEYNPILPTESMVMGLTYNILSTGIPYIPIELSLDAKYLDIGGRNSSSQYVTNGYRIMDNQRLYYFERYTPLGNSCMEEVLLSAYPVTPTAKLNIKSFSVHTMSMSMATFYGGKCNKTKGYILCVGDN